MSRLTWGELQVEWSRSCTILSEILGEQVTVASVPDGYYSRKVGQSAAEAGIEVLFTSEPTVSTSVLDHCLILGRYFILVDTPPTTSAAIAAGCFWPRWRQTVLWEVKRPLKALAGESYFTMRRYLIDMAMVKKAGDVPWRADPEYGKKKPPANLTSDQS
jgi:hypothetical protein